MVKTTSPLCFVVPRAEKKLKDLNKIFRLRKKMYDDIHFDDLRNYNNHLSEMKALVNSMEAA
jgi:hypothetical protein